MTPRPRAGKSNLCSQVPQLKFRSQLLGIDARRCGASGPTELRHEIKRIAAINAGEIWRIEVAACEALYMVGSGSEGKIGAKEDLLG